MRNMIGLTAVALSALVISAMVGDAVRIGFVDPLSGGREGIGQIGNSQPRFIADEIGAKVEIVGHDNRTGPRLSLAQMQQPVDEGMRIVVQADRSSVAVAAADFITTYNDLDPGVAKLAHLRHADGRS